MDCNTTELNETDSTGEQHSSDDLVRHFLQLDKKPHVPETRFKYPVMKNTADTADQDTPEMQNLNTDSKGADDVVPKCKETETQPKKPSRVDAIIMSNKFFGFLLLNVVVMRYAVVAYARSVSTTLGLQFPFSLTQKQALGTVADIGELPFLLIFAFLGRNSRRRPIWITVGLVVTTVGCALCGCPHWLLEPAQPTPPMPAFPTDFCKAGTAIGTEPDAQPLATTEFPFSSLNPNNWNVTDIVTSAPNATIVHSLITADTAGDKNAGPGIVSPPPVKLIYMLIFLGLLLIGIGCSFVTPLALTYLDDANKTQVISIYVALMVLGRIAGPLAGGMIRSLVILLYVDFDRIEKSLLPEFTTAIDPTWLGAWWLGFFLFAFIFINFAVLFIAHYKRKALYAVPTNYSLVGQIELTQQGNGDVKTGDDAKKQRLVEPTEVNEKTNAFIDFVCTYKKLLENTGLIFIALALCALNAYEINRFEWGLQYIMAQYSLSLDDAAAILSYVFGPLSMIGVIGGGYLLKRKNWTVLQMAKFGIAMHILSLLLSVVLLLLGCNTPSIAGVNNDYIGSAKPCPALPLPAGSSAMATSSCNIDCQCIPLMLEPVCGSDDITYVSGCYAGCSDFIESNNTFSNCKCIGDNVNADRNQTATKGRCSTGCGLATYVMWVFISALAFTARCLGAPALFVIIMRCVDREDRAPALAITFFLVTALAYIPAPRYFNYLLHKQCMVWSVFFDIFVCHQYDLTSLRLTYHGLTTSLQLIAVILLVLGYNKIKHRIKPSQNDQERV